MIVRAPRSCAAWRGAGLLVLFAAVCLPAFADAGWFESGDTTLRMDLQLLNDAGVIVVPLNQWPLPRTMVRHALELAKEHRVVNAAVAAALERVRARSAPPAAAHGSPAVAVRAGRAGLWRDFDTVGREDGELEGSFDFGGDRFAFGLAATAVTNPRDGNEVRFDGSHATVQLGNWLVSANTLDRWWGPAHEGSLILSNNARPMPTFMVERAEARPFKSRWLSWLGPYRFSFGISQMENHRLDIDSPLYMAWRVEVMPWDRIELGFSRTAQFCGRQLLCNLNVFGNLIAGNDNVGIDATAENEPGNQMAGFDMRWNSPIGHLPYAIYAQYIGEDESSYLPAKFLNQLGVEVWKPWADGSILQVHAEYASTTCSANSHRGPYYNCAYNQGRFDVEGYRYHGRVIGFTTDRDTESWALGAKYVRENGSLWTLTGRFAELNHDDIGDVNNTVASVPTTYFSIEAGWKGVLHGQHLALDFGVQSLQPYDAGRNVEAFGFLGWRHEFAP